MKGAPNNMEELWEFIKGRLLLTPDDLVDAEIERMVNQWATKFAGSDKRSGELLRAKLYDLAREARKEWQESKLQ